MSTEHTHDNESTDIEPRTRRALERVLTVTHTDGTPIREGDDTDDDGLDPRVREHVEEYGSPAHGYDHAPEL